TCIELLVLAMPQRELGAEVIPRELHEFQSVEGSGTGGGPVVRERDAQRVVRQERCVRRHLEGAGAEQLAHGFGDLVIIVRAPVKRGIQSPPVNVHKAVANRRTPSSFPAKLKQSPPSGPVTLHSAY